MRQKQISLCSCVTLKTDALGLDGSEISTLHMCSLARLGVCM